MTDTIPEVISPPVSDTVPNDGIEQGKNDDTVPPDSSSIAPELFDPSLQSLSSGIMQTISARQAPDDENRGRGRPKGATKYASPEEAKEAKRSRDRARSKARYGKAEGLDAENETAQEFEPEAKPQPAANGLPNEALGAAAVMIVGTMDMLLLAITDNEYRAPDDMRKLYIQSWVNYLKTVGKEPPPWLMVTIMSGAYCLPAIQTPAAQSKWAKVKANVRGWWAAKFGG